MSTSASSSCCSVTRGQGRPARYAPRRPHSFAAATRLAPHAQLAAAASSSGRALAPAALRRASGVTHSAPADASTTAAGGGGEGGREAWFQKKSEYVTDLKSRAEVEAFAKNGSKYTVLDLYAGWCGGCKAAYPAYIKVAMGDGLRKDFQFGKTSIEVEDVKELIKQHGISNIPYVMVFAPDGTYLTGFSATFKKMDVVKKNLATIAATRSPRYMLDPNGFVLPAQ